MEILKEGEEADQFKRRERITRINWERNRRTTVEVHREEERNQKDFGEGKGY